MKGQRGLDEAGGASSSLRVANLGLHGPEGTPPRPVRVGFTPRRYDIQESFVAFFR
jgi:hypothetical protein